MENKQNVQPNQLNPGQNDQYGNEVVIKEEEADGCDQKRRLKEKPCR